MSADGWITIAIVLLVIGLLIFTRFSPDVVFMGGLTLLLTAGIIDGHELFQGLANPGVVTIGVLFVVATGLEQTGGMNLLSQKLLGRPKSLISAQSRIMLPVAGLSAFMNNTPLVAMMMPVLNDWSRKLGFSNSKLFIPLSFASILGGACTLIGTSTILVVNGLIIDHAGADGLPVQGMGMFTITAVGLPCAVVGLIYLIVVGRWLLPDRQSAITTEGDARKYTVEMLIEKGSPLSGKTIEKADLRHLPGLYLMEIERRGQVMAAVSSNIVLQDEDRLVFAGVIESVVDLQKIRGLIPATNQVFKLNEPRTNRQLVEAVVSSTCPIVGRSIREGRFRSVYNAAVIAVARHGHRINKKIGDIVLMPGDTLLLEARASFVEQHRNSKDFYLISSVKNSTPPRHEKAPIALLILGLLVVSVTAGWLSMLNASLLAAGAMLITRCCNMTSARHSINWQVLIVIAAAMGIGKAIENSGAAQVIAQTLLAGAGSNKFVVLAVITALAMIFTNLVNAQAAVAMMFPITMAAAGDLGVDPMPLVIAMTMGAAYSFVTPIGYQTNLMVFGPGGYRFTDYVKIGLPLSVIVLVVVVVLTPFFWPM